MGAFVSVTATTDHAAAPACRRFSHCSCPPTAATTFILCADAAGYMRAGGKEGRREEGRETRLYPCRNRITLARRVAPWRQRGNTVLATRDLPRHFTHLRHARYRRVASRLTGTLFHRSLSWLYRCRGRRPPCLLHACLPLLPVTSASCHKGWPCLTFDSLLSPLSCTSVAILHSGNLEPLCLLQHSGSTKHHLTHIAVL